MLLQIVKDLLKNGADENLQNRGKTCVDIAKRERKTEVGFLFRFETLIVGGTMG